MVLFLKIQMVNVRYSCEGDIVSVSTSKAFMKDTTKQNSSHSGVNFAIKWLIRSFRDRQNQGTLHLYGKKAAIEQWDGTALSKRG